MLKLDKLKGERELKFLISVTSVKRRLEGVLDYQYFVSIWFVSPSPRF